MKKLKASLLALTISFSVSTLAQKKEKMDAIDIKVQALLKKMTLDEKIGQLNLYNGFWDVTGPVPKDGSAAQKYENIKKGLVGSMLNVRGVKDVKALQKIAVEQTRLGIPLIFGFDVIHGYKTISPIPLAEVASWDLKAIESSARMAAIEASAAGINWTFAPMVDVARDARWGRVMEGAGEDPYLGSLVAVARIKGFQGDKLTDKHAILACAKHFAGYAFAEAGRDYNTVDFSESTLQNIVLPPFKAAVDAGVRTFMNSFNIVDGVPATGNAYLQRKILKGDWGYNGYVVSDWGSINEMIPHGFAKDSKEAALHAIKAGSDMDMESYAYVNNLKTLVQEKKVDVKLIDDAAGRILRTKFELGLFDNPYKYCDTESEAKWIGHADFQKEVLEMAKKSIVLLKNEKGILPLSKNNSKIALIGPLASDKTSPLGSWCFGAEPNSAVSVLEGMQKYIANIAYQKGVNLAIGKTEFGSETPINTTDRTGIAEAVALAKTSDVVVMVLGEHGFQSGEGRSRAEIDLPGLQQELLEAVYAVNPNIVLVLQNGRPLALPWAAKNIPAIVEAWQLGSQSGNAVAEVLFGDFNPSGKLPMSFPQSVGQLPLYYNHNATGRPSKNGEDSVFWSHYIDMPNAPLFPFGYGLSYTTFDYSDIKISNKVLKDKESIEVSVVVKNTGARKGREVVQLYIHDLVASGARPVKELKGFDAIELNPGESKTVVFKIQPEMLKFFSSNKVWENEAGDFDVFVGTNSQTNLKTSFYFNK